MEVMAQKNSETTRRRGKGFQHASGLLSARIREVGEARGFAVTRLLTHWTEIAGAEMARYARPVDVSYGRAGFGATLTLLTTGAHAPMIEMQKEALREKVNACYGYSAISRIRITQTSATGFSEGVADFTPAKQPALARDSRVASAAKEVAAPVTDDALRDALAALGANVLSRKRS